MGLQHACLHDVYTYVVWHRVLHLQKQRSTGSMFWKATYSQASPLEGILEKQHITLEELLDEEDLIQVHPFASLYLLRVKM